MVEAIRQGDIPGVQLRCRRALPVSVELAWSWITEADRLRRWIAPEARVELLPEGSLRVESLAEEGAALREEATTLEISRPQRWVLAFQRQEAGWQVATRLTIELRPDPEGCELSILQEGFEHLPLSECLTIWEAYRRRWRAALELLAKALSQGPSPDDSAPGGS